MAVGENVLLNLNCITLYVLLARIPEDALRAIMVTITTMQAFNDIARAMPIYVLFVAQKFSLTQIDAE